MPAVPPARVRSCCSRCRRATEAAVACSRARSPSPKAPLRVRSRNDVAPSSCFLDSAGRRQRGQRVASFRRLANSSKQVAWNTCGHLASGRTCWPSSMSSRQIVHIRSSAEICRGRASSLADGKLLVLTFADCCGEPTTDSRSNEALPAPAPADTPVTATVAAWAVEAVWAEGCGPCCSMRDGRPGGTCTIRGGHNHSRRACVSRRAGHPRIRQRNVSW
mmetsp:Transcript_42307/g.122819  ORF Transcript_42307/g.122819 Transcript_42307/m.122819 type:complete len:219 (-) Transcript_42307:14-670(-)